MGSLVKMRCLGKKKGLELSWEGPYKVMRYKDEQGFLEFDGCQVCLLQDDDEQVWKWPRRIQRSCNLQPELDLGGPKFYTLGSGYIM